MHAPLRLLRAATALLLCAALPAGCGDSLPPGPVPSGYVESPLRPEAQAFAPALQTSNAVLELLQKGETAAVYQRYVDPRLQQKASAEQFAKPLQATFAQLGPIAAFKPLQWGFTQGESEGMRVLYCTKIVAHERGWITWQFTFEEGKYERFTGIAVQERKPGQR
jgi:hypothetical protein